MEVDTGAKSGVTSDQSKRMKALERENRELKRANEILKKAAAFFAQAELDRKPRSCLLQAGRVDFIDQHRDEHGVEPICKELPTCLPVCSGRLQAGCTVHVSPL